MPSGKRSRSLHEVLRAAFPALALAALLVSCGSGRSFDRSLSRLDSALGAAAGQGSPGSRDAALPYPGRKPPVAPPLDPARLRRLVDSAARHADTSSDWLRLFSRARSAGERIGNPGLAARIADEARKKYPNYEDIALAACSAYLDAGRASDALALFPNPLDPEARSSWFAEAFLEAYRATGRGTPGAGDSDALRRVMEGSGRGEPGIDAALLRMGAGDREGAAWFLRRAAGLGIVPDPDLAWDTGVLDSLLSNPDRSTEGRDLERKADAALLLGEQEWAKEYLAELVRVDPGYSWKAYTVLAYLEGSRTGSDYWYDRLAATFPSSPEAVRARAAYLSRTDRDGEALAELEGGPGWPGDGRTAVLAAEIRMKLRPGDSRAVTALGLANAFPEDPYVQKWALGRLAAADKFPDAAETYRQLKSRGMDLGRPWYLEALSLILEGRTGEAIALIERDGPGDDGPEAPFALGILYEQAGNHGLAVERFRIAVSAAMDAEGKSRALTELGKSLEAAGDRGRAREAWAAALSLSPDYAEALRLLTAR